MAQDFSQSRVASGFLAGYVARMTDTKNAVLADLLKEAGGTTQVAAACGVTDSAVRHWVRKGRVPRTAALLLHTLYPNYAVADLTQ